MWMLEAGILKVKNIYTKIGDIIRNLCINIYNIP